MTSLIKKSSPTPLSTGKKLLIGAGSLTAVAAGVFGIVYLMDDLGKSLNKTYGIRLHDDCFTLNPESKYYYPESPGDQRTENPARNLLVGASDLLQKLGPAGKQADGKLRANNLVCVAPQEKLKEQFEAVGLFDTAVVVGDRKTPAWAASQFAEPEIASLPDALTQDSRKLITSDAMLWHRLREGVAETYRIYATWLLAAAESPSDPAASPLWAAVENAPALQAPAAAFKSAVTEGREPRQAWRESLETYLTTPESVNGPDEEFLNRYAVWAGQQISAIYYDATCRWANLGYVNDNSINVTTTLPEGVRYIDVVTGSLKRNIEDKCGSKLRSARAHAKAEQSEARREIARLSRTKEDRRRNSLRISSLRSDLNTPLPFRLTFTDSVNIRHNPPRSTHSMRLAPETLVVYVAKVTGIDDFLSVDEANKLLTDGIYRETHSDKVVAAQQKADRNALTFANNYKPLSPPTPGEGLK